MEDGQHRDFVGGLVNNIDNDIRRFYELSCPFAQAGTPDVGQAGSRKPVDARQDPPDESGSGLPVVLRNPVEDVVEVAGSGLANDDLHSSMRRASRSLNSSRVSLRGFGSASRRSTSATCSSVSR